MTGDGEGTKQRLLESYRSAGAFNTASDGLPTRRHLMEVLHDVEEVIFPGFTGERLSRAPDPVWLDARIARLRALLADVVGMECKECDTRSVAEATEIADAFIEALPGLRQLLLEDVQALHQGDPASQSIEEVILAYPGLRAVLVHRIAHHFWGTGARLLARMMAEHIHSQTGVDIHPGATIGRGFHIDHGTGVVVGETTHIGDHVKIYQGVSLGALSVSRRKFGEKRHPTIEDHVTIYAGATILGGDTVVGHHSIIGGNVWLVKSVPSYSVVENDPTIRVRPKQDHQAWFYEI